MSARDNPTRRNTPPVLAVLLAALLFGASAPLSKLLLSKVDPLPLASFLYLGSGLGALLFLALRRLSGRRARRARGARPPVGGRARTEAPLRLKDAPWLAGAVLAGGVAAPIALLFGLKDTPAATASLLLNFEAVSTALIALIFFREHAGARTWTAVAVMTAASVILSVRWGGPWGISTGTLGVLAACVLWGADNNLTRQISAKDPAAIVAVKGLAAGSISLVLAVTTGQKLPAVGLIGLSLATGCVCYGASIVLFIVAMRGMGAARSSALFATAPFFGALFSFVIFKDALSGLTWQFGIAALLMALGTWLLVGERHEHAHTHEVVVHEHRHHHDDLHHEHSHCEIQGKTTGSPKVVKRRRFGSSREAILQGESHSHPHKHDEVAHSHPHKPDTHHRHGHVRGGRKS